MKRLLEALVLCLMVSAPASGQRDALNLEQAVCGFKEPFYFWLWSTAAGRADPSRLGDLDNVEDVILVTKDRRTLKGYRLMAQPSRKPPHEVDGYVLIAQGNAVLADQILNSFAAFARRGYDVYVFDYRGYGRSQGKRRLKAIVNDYAQIIDHLQSLGYPARRFYAMSFGGIVLLNALRLAPESYRIAVDSTPSRLSDHGCPEHYDPVNNIPRDASNHLVIAGLKDSVVEPAQSRDLLERAQAHGGVVVRDPEFAHPFMDSNPSVQKRRMETVMRFLFDP